MTRERIERAAGEYSGSVLGFKDNPVVMNKHKAFMDGAQWRINSVWHDINEKPKEHKLVLVEDDFCGEPDYSVWQTPFPNREDSIVHFSSKRWAYIDDLLPERKEETE